MGAMMKFQSFVVKLIVLIGYFIVLSMVVLKASWDSSEDKELVRIWSAKLIPLSRRFVICASLLPSMARNTPRVSLAWDGSNRRRCSRFPDTPHTLSSPGCSWEVEYRQELFSHTKWIRYQKLLSTQRAPLVVIVRLPSDQ